MPVEISARICPAIAAAAESLGGFVYLSRILTSATGILNPLTMPGPHHRLLTPLCLLRVIALVLAIAACELPAIAQTAPDLPVGAATSPAAPSVGDKGAEAPRPAAPDAFYLLDEKTGQPIRMPANATIQEFIEFMKRRETPKPEGPAYSFTSVELTGSADDERALLTARIQVQINRADEWVQVPLGLTEAVLRDSQAQGGGDTAFGGFDRESGYRWWFRGKGQHELRLALSVPVRKQSPRRTVQLTLPSAAVSHLTLTVPMPAPNVKVSNQAAVKTRALTATTAEIEVFGLGSRLDLTWQPLPSTDPLETSLEAATSIIVRLTGDQVILEATQVIRALQGTFSEVTVQLPHGFELVDVEGKEYAQHRLDPRNPDQATVVLTAPTSGPVSLKWTVRRRVPTREKLRIQGFSVAKARTQTGEIGIMSLEGYRVTTQEGSDANVHRINVGELRPQLVRGQISSAYRFLKQPFHLVLGLEPVEPYFMVEPRMFVRLSSDRISLEGVFPFQVFRGGIDAVMLSWPGRKQDGWTIDSIEPPGVLEQSDDHDQIQIRLLERMTENFELRLKARKEVADVTVPQEFHLPRASASNVLPMLLVVANAENVESEFFPIGETSARPLSAQSRKRIRLPETFEQARLSEFRVESEEQAFSARITVQPPQRRTETVAEAEFEEGQLRVTQRILYHVEYERLAQVRVWVPPAIQDQVRFFSDEQVELTPSWDGVADRPLRQARLDLEEPRLGDFEIVAQFAIPLPKASSSGEQQTVSVPLVLAADAEYTSSRFELIHAGQIQASAASPKWEVQSSLDGVIRWTAAGPQPEFPLAIARAGQARPYSISKAFVRTVFFENGGARTRAQFRLMGSAPQFTVALPPGSTLSGVWWNADPISSEQMSGGADGSGELMISVSPRSEQPDLLTIDYQTSSAQPFRWADRKTARAPLFPESQWTGQTVWQLALPGDHHLLAYPDDLTTQFHWERQAVFWSRITRPDAEEIQKWIGGADGPAPVSLSDDAATPSGNLYGFTQLGAPTELRFASMSRPMIVLVGAALPLLLGYVLLRLPGTRHLLAVLLLGCAATIAALWIAPALELLVQPALFGFALALAAIALERRFHRDHAVDVLTLSSASDFIAPLSSQNRPAPAGAGSDDPTMLREGSGVQRDLARKESGARP